MKANTCLAAVAAALSLFVRGASFVPAGGDLASQTADDWNPASVPTSATAVSIPNAGTYWASENVTFKSLTFSATGETVVDQHAKGYDGVKVTAKGDTWALTQSANASVVCLKGGIWDFSGKYTKLGYDSGNRSGCGLYVDDGAQITLGEWRGSVHWSSSTQMLDHASTVTASGASFFIYDRENKKYAQNNRFIVKGGSVFKAYSFGCYSSSSAFGQATISGNELIVTGVGSKMEMTTGKFTIGGGVGEDFTVRIEDGGEIFGGSGVKFGSSNNRLIVDGGKLSPILDMGYSHNRVELMNLSDMTLSLPTSMNPIDGAYNTILMSNALVRTATVYPFDSGSNNVIRVTGGATWQIGNEQYIDIARDVATANNKLVIDAGGRVDAGFIRVSGDQNEVVISNGTLCANKINDEYGIVLGYYTSRTCTPVLRLQGTHPSVTKGEGKVVFVAKAGAELRFELPPEGYTSDPIIDMGAITVNSGVTISVDCQECQRALTASGVSKATYTLMQHEQGMTINAAVLAAANANIVADYPERCRIYVDGSTLKLEVKSRPKGLALFFR